MKILVVQTTRLGDMIQTSPMISQLRAQYPQAHIAVLSRGLAKTVAERLPEVDEIILYDDNVMFADMRAQDSNRLLRAYARAEEMVATLKEREFDLAFNMTHSISSAMLLKLAGIPQVVGAHISEDGRFVLRGNWTSYFFTSVFSREYNDLNLCDITRHFAEGAPHCRKLTFEVKDEERAFVRDLLQQHAISDNEFVVCLQLGASENNKRWAERRFAELAVLLRERFQARVLLVGVKEEAVLGDLFERHAPAVAVHLFGQTNVPQLAALLERANLLVTNDTGTMHVAAAVGCPITLVSVGHVHFRETGPFGEGHVAVESRRATLGRSDHVPGAAEERERITAEQVYAAVELTLDPGHTVVQEAPLLSEVEFYRSAFAPDGCLEFYPLLKRRMLERDAGRIVYRAMWIGHLNGTSNLEVEEAAMRAMFSAYDLAATEGLRDLLDKLDDGFEGLGELAARGEAATEPLVALLHARGSMAQAREQVAALMALDEETRVYGELHPVTKPLVLLARFERDNLEGADPLTLAETTRGIYGGLRARAELMREKIGVARKICCE